MGKKIILLQILVFFCLILSASAQSLPDPTGLWQTEGGKSIVEIISLPETKTWAAHIVWLKDSVDKEGNPLYDVLNPDPKKRENAVMGLTIAWGFKVGKDNAWKDGQVYDPETGKTYKAQARMKDGELELRGYIGIPALGRSTSWVQVSHLPSVASEKGKDLSWNGNKQ
ncbi:DUF2147 domain-containing protein [Desulfobotulus sp.]|jgi:uncharacterized protein (DUF2147 family)|uniref:DUF2147 domain-containing protein n=1 Tax=Desulfobotulus sp. TaxID=1940337 RepID=UPI002A36BB84|nr:DUF2147 domain-containing protein [Desulfobotulus sp.]MDY0163910.1 DUF2147 domain-containing protein [Desulfobotulus sp.]